jgi:hypothetical protein
MILRGREKAKTFYLLVSLVSSAIGVSISSARGDANTSRRTKEDGNNKEGIRQDMEGTKYC